MIFVVYVSNIKNKMIMVHIVFEYRDEYCRDGKFRRQECNVRSLEECKQIYGLDTCEYRIISVEEC